MAAFHPRLKNEHIQNYEELASYPFGPFGEKCVLYATFFMAVGSKEYFLFYLQVIGFLCSHFPRPSLKPFFSFCSGSSPFFPLVWCPCFIFNYY